MLDEYKNIERNMLESLYELSDVISYVKRKDNIIFESNSLTNYTIFPNIPKRVFTGMNTNTNIDQMLSKNNVISLNKFIVYLQSRNDCKDLLDQLIELVINPFNEQFVYKAHSGLMRFLKDNEYNFPTDFDFSHWNLACKNLITILDRLDFGDLERIKQDDPDGIKQLDFAKQLTASIKNRRLDRQILLLSVLETISYRYNCELNSFNTPSDFTMWQVNVNTR